MLAFLTEYHQGDKRFTEIVAARNVLHARWKAWRRGLGERITTSGIPFALLRGRESALDDFDAGNYAKAAHAAAQMLRLTGSSWRMRKALEDDGLLHGLLHLAAMPDEPVVFDPEARRRLRIELKALEREVRPWLRDAYARAAAQVLEGAAPMLSAPLFDLVKRAEPSPVEPNEPTTTLALRRYRDAADQAHQKFRRALFKTAKPLPDGPKLADLAKGPAANQESFQ